MNARNIVTAAIASAALLGTGTAGAESQLNVGATPSASARLDFRVIIPEFIFFRVGSTGGTIDLVEFDLSGIAGFPGDGTPVNATGGTGDGADGSVTVRLVGNTDTNVQIAENATSLSNGVDTIPFTQVTTTAGGTIAAPTLGAGTPVNLGSGVQNLTDTWTYQYANSVTPNPGTYGGVNLNGGRVTYTASAP